MTDHHHSSNPSAKELFARALELPPSERRAFVEHECAGNHAVRDDALALLDQHARAGGFMSSPTARAAAPANPAAPIEFPPLPALPSALLPALPSEQPGSKIGPYKLLQQIGEGGFGAVFMAEQAEPVRRRVALKLIRLGMDTKQFIARFEAERQALAVMNHPNIAKVFDAGATSEGRPYFVMELVAGEDITTYCERNKLSVRQRLDLFLQVCRAVQHAHTKGIIHRDLKPSNILVSTHEGEPCAKVIDFGIAKATSRPLTDKTFFTEHMAMLGTPAYCSPEQISGSPDIDTRSDVYALGGLLYELLSGTTPFDAKELRAKAWDEVCRTIKEDEPPAPSVRLSSQNSLPLGGRGRAGERGPHEASALARLIRGELDWITLKCLDKAPGRRYESASALATDIERHLSGEAVIAAPPSAAYRVRKFVRKNKAAVAVGMALVVGVIGTSTGMVMAWRANIEHERLVHAAVDGLEGVSDVLAQSSDPTVARDQAARDLMNEITVSLERGEAVHMLAARARTLAEEVNRRSMQIQASNARMLENGRRMAMARADYMKEVVTTSLTDNIPIQQYRDAWSDCELYLGPGNPATIEMLFEYGMALGKEEHHACIAPLLEAISRKESGTPEPDSQLIRMWGHAAGACAWHLEFEHAEILSQKLARALPNFMHRKYGEKNWLDGPWTSTDWGSKLGWVGGRFVPLLPVQPAIDTGRPVAVTAEKWKIETATMLAEFSLPISSSWHKTWQGDEYRGLDVGTPPAIDCLIYAELALSVRPDLVEGHRALALAQFRLGEYQEALAAISRAEELIAVASARPHPLDLAIEALIRWQLGKHNEARRTLDRACEALSGLVSSGAVNDNWEISDTRRLIEEAESLIEGRLVYPMP